MSTSPHKTPPTASSSQRVLISMAALIIGVIAIGFTLSQLGASNKPGAPRVPTVTMKQPDPVKKPDAAKPAAPTNPATAPPAAPAPPASNPPAAAPASAAPATPAASNDSLPDSAVDASIAATLDKVVKENDLPGMAAAVIVNGKILGAGVAGIRKKKGSDPKVEFDPNQFPVLRDDPFFLGTATKPLTATLIGILVDEGKLKWDSTIGDLVGRDISSINPDFAGVTIDQLLHHRSGSWPNGPSEIWEAAKRAKGTPVEQRIAYVEAILSQPPRFPPGKYLYSNAGYAILGFIAETITNTPYETLMEQKVFAPLGLKSAGFGNAGSADEVTAPYPHIESGLPTFLVNPEAVTPAARIHMNVTDWAKFCLVHLGHQPTPPLLKPETLEHLHTLAGEVAEDKSGYACGWMRPEREWAGGRTLSHPGRSHLSDGVVWLSPQKDFGVLVATNQGGDKAKAAVEQAASALIAQFLPAKK
ncbi:MAG: beta-lactamase family protein [Planctomycetes bacterium]|nr:beta-lactamase family protein [Planctomycetota bacterium]